MWQCGLLQATLQTTLRSDVDEVYNTDRSSRHDTFRASDGSEMSCSVPKRNGEIPFEDRTAIERCRSHELIEVPRNNLGTFKPGYVDEQERSLMAWASVLYDRYRETNSTP